ncbi:MAG TPA: PRD domain-containing protein [Clostridiales bacterium]|nr:PRD domain-containing protein [Clostridiales bacterium]
MKTNKERVYELLKLQFIEGQSAGASTKVIADALSIQRTNVSAILTVLDSEGLVVKKKGRPVLYFAKNNSIQDDVCFSKMIGSQGSLKHAVQLAKAAILYPQSSLKTLIVGAHGTGKKMLAGIMLEYACKNGVLPPHSPCHIYYCERSKTNEQIYMELFGTANDGGIYQDLRNCALILDGVEVISTAFCTHILDALEAKSSADEAPIVILLLNGECGGFSNLKKRFPITIEMPTLRERPMDERFAFVQNFLSLEAAHVKRPIAINSELLRCLLLYDTDLNVTQLQHDIKIGCANAYVRERAISSEFMNLYVSDFENYVRKGFLYYRAHREEIERIIPYDYNYRFDGSGVQVQAVEQDTSEDGTQYTMIEQRSQQLAKRGVPRDEISVIIATELESMNQIYEKNFSSQEISTSQLQNLIDSRIIPLVQDFLENTSVVLMKRYPPSVFYGICLHLDSTLKNRNKKVDISNEQIREIIENYNKEYTLSLLLATTINETFGVQLPMEEAVLIAMFISFQAVPSDTSDKPVLLFAFRGSGLAQAFATLVNQSLQLDNAFYFEVPMKQEPAEYFDAFCSYIKRIHRGKGILALYDADFMRNVLEVTALETGIDIRKTLMPYTEIALTLSRKAATDNDLDSIFQELAQVVNYQTKPKPNVIITLCATGMGGAVRLKEYIEQHGGDDKTRIIPLAAASREQLREELVKVMERANISCVVGTYDPGMFGLAFISSVELFNCEKGDLPHLLKNVSHYKKGNVSLEDYESIYQYLGEHLEYVSIAKVRKYLPGVIEEISSNVLKLSSDTRVGLFLHIPCSIERVLAKGKTPVCIQKTQIIRKYGRAYKKLLKILKPLENAFHVIFSDDELALLITIIYKL